MTVTTAELNDLFRYCEDIGMYATDRPINDTANHTGSCDHRTPHSLFSQKRAYQG